MPGEFVPLVERPEREQVAPGEPGGLIFFESERRPMGVVGDGDLLDPTHGINAPVFEVGATNSRIERNRSLPYFSFQIRGLSR